MTFVSIASDRSQQQGGGRDLTFVITYAGVVAEERFETGYDLTEVQAGFNALFLTRGRRSGARASTP